MAALPNAAGTAALDAAGTAALLDLSSFGSPAGQYLKPPPPVGSGAVPGADRDGGTEAAASGCGDDADFRCGVVGAELVSALGGHQVRPYGRHVSEFPRRLRAANEIHELKRYMRPCLEELGSATSELDLLVELARIKFDSTVP